VSKTNYKGPLSTADLVAKRLTANGAVARSIETHGAVAIAVKNRFTLGVARVLRF
tara:strand:- start:63 stop:227 length:165 start_codon:yes stop_codon:yes gene_type:complete